MHRLQGQVEGESAPATLFFRHPWVIWAVAALAGSVAPSAPYPALLSLLIWLLFAGRDWFSRPRAFLRTAALFALFILSGTRSLAEVQEYRGAYRQARSEIKRPQRCFGLFEVTSSPTIRTRDTPDRSSKGAPSKNSASNSPEERVTLWTGKSDGLDCESQQVSGPVWARLYGGPADLSRGDRVELVAQLAPKRLFRNAGLPDPWPGAAGRKAVLSGSILSTELVSHGQGLSGAIDRKRASVRERINAGYSPRVRSLGRALILGESDLHPDDAEAFRDSGLLHLLAVSGTHLVIAVLALVGLSRALLVRLLFLCTRFDPTRLSAAMGAVLSLLYADFSGGSGSAWRAAFMLCVVLGARSLGFRVGGAGALGASLLIGIAINPLAGSDFSFLLSALATAGLIGIGQPLSRLLEGSVLTKSWLRPVTLSFIATVSSTMVCAPVLAMMDGSMTLAALFANVVAGPLGELIALPACLLHSVVPAGTSLEQGLATLGSGALLAVREVALWSASIKEAQFEVAFPSSYNLCLGICVSLLFFSLRSWKSRLSLALIGACFSAPISSTESPLPQAREEDQKAFFSVTALDVGQGDALFLDFPDGKVGLMDGGGFATGVPDTGQRVLLPYLRSRSIKALDLVILSHPHPDHMNGLLSLSQTIPFKEFWIPGAGVKLHGALKTLVERVKAKGGRVLVSEQLCQRTLGPSHHGLGTFQFGGLQIEALSPCHESEPPLSANDASLVLRFTHGKRRALLTGDIEKETESNLTRTERGRLEADLLKVGHHGSHTSSSPAFVRAVAPEVAFISCGVRNRFDHPRPETLDTLAHQGTRVFRTDENGSVSWRTDGLQTEIRSFSRRLRSTDPSNAF